MEEKELNKKIVIVENHSRNNVPRMDFEILVNFYRICKKKGITEGEVSFLFGMHDKYFTEILNPFNKEDIKSEFLDILPSIASTSIQKIIPNQLLSKETIDIQGSYIFEKNIQSELIYYKFTVSYIDGTRKNYRWKIEINKGNRAQVNNDLLKILKKLISNGYFKKPKYVLTLYLFLKEKLKLKLSPLSLQIALSKLINKKIDPDYALEKGVNNNRIVYGKVMTAKDIFSNFCQNNNIWISKYEPLKHISSLFFIWYQDIDQNDKLLTWKNGKILYAHTINDLLQLLKDNDKSFNPPINLAQWLLNMKDLLPSEAIIYSPNRIMKGFAKQDIPDDILEDYVNLINVIGDLAYQEKQYVELLSVHDSPVLKMVWNYYNYHYLFKSKKNEELAFDRNEFKIALKQLVEKFEEYI